MYGDIENFRVVSDGCGGFMKQPIGFSRGMTSSLAICDLSIMCKIQKVK